MQRQRGIAGVGCALLDILHADASFAGPGFDRYASRVPGDGGLVPGQLVFTEALEAFAGVSVDRIVGEICGGAPAETNLGGPAIVALVHAAQVLGPARIPVRFFGLRGNDDVGARIAEIVHQTPLDPRDYRPVDGPSPATRVLSDPSANGGAGERTFINTIGVADRFRVRTMPAEFFAYDIAFFGGTALVPTLHAELGEALHSARSRGQLTVVATVYDFLNESRAPTGLWPLGDGQRDYPLIDLLITDAEEARRLTGCDAPADAVRRMLDWGAGAAIVTHGERPVTFATATGRRFAASSVATLPVSDEVQRRAASVDPANRDTTGCGDNFAGGVLTHLAGALAAHPATPVDLSEAVVQGVCAGAAAWFQLGGTYVESQPGEVARRVESFRSAYLRQVGRA